LKGTTDMKTSDRATLPPHGTPDRKTRRKGAPFWAAAAAGLLLAACAQTAAPTFDPPQPRASGASYRYVTDQELEQVTREATNACNRQQSIPHARAFSVDAGGAKVVSFECLRVSPLPSQQPDYNPNLGFNMLSPQEASAASRNAEAYCMRNGAHKLVTNTRTTSTGETAVKFECASP